MRKVSSREALTPLKALVIGVEPTNVAAMSMLFQRRGYDVALFGDLSETAARLARERFECVIFECRSRDEMNKIRNLLDSPEMDDHRDRCVIVATNMQAYNLNDDEKRSAHVQSGPVTGGLIDRILLATGFGPPHSYEAAC